MKKMLMILAIMALATGAFAAWSGVSDMGDTTLTDDLVGGIGTSTATIYAKFRILGPEFTISSGSTIDMWRVTNFMPGDFGWQPTPFRIENTGGVTLQLGTRASENVTTPPVTNAAGAYALDWTGTVNTYKIWALIMRNGGTPAATAGMTGTNNLNFTSTAAGWYGDDGTVDAYMVPAATPYWHATGTNLNLWATDRDGGSNDDLCDLWLGAQMPFAGWTMFTDKLVTITVYGDISTASH